MGIEATKRLEGTVLGHFYIGPRKFEVLEVDDLRGDDKADLIGWYRTVQGQLAIQTGMTPETSEITFLHEVIHGWLELGGHDLSSKRAEFICDVISQQLYQSIHDNPDYYLRLVNQAIKGEIS
jgi:hypothetical protein